MNEALKDVDEILSRLSGVTNRLERVAEILEYNSMPSDPILTSDIKRREEALSEMEKKLNIGSWSWDIIQDRLRWSDQLFKIHNMERQEIDYMSIMRFTHPDDIVRVLAAMDEAVATCKPFEFPYRVILDDGTEKVLYAKGEVIVDENNKPIKVVGTDQDITDKNLEELVDESKDLRGEAAALRESIVQFAAITRRGLIRATWQGIIMIIVGVTFSISLLGYLGKPYTCEVENLVDHAGKFQNQVCEIIFPQVEQQKDQLIKGREQAAAVLKAQEDAVKASKERAKQFEGLRHEIESLKSEIQDLTGQ